MVFELVAIWAFGGEGVVWLIRPGIEGGTNQNPRLRNIGEWVSWGLTRNYSLHRLV